MSGIINQSVLSEIPIPLSPAVKGKRALRCPLDFSVNSTWTFNLLLQQWQDVISAVTCLYIDNADNTESVVIDVNITQQRITAAPGTQGYYAVLVPSTFQFTISSVGSTAQVNLYILNFTPSNNVWGGSGVTPPGTQNVNIVSSITLPISGVVAVSNLPAIQPVSGTVAVSNLPATQPISGAVSVSNFPATQPVSGTVAVSNLPATQDENLIKLAGTAIDVNSGNKSAGTQRVILATDQPALTNAWGVIPTQQNSGDLQKPWYVGNKVKYGAQSSNGSLVMVTGTNFYIVSAYCFNIDLSTTNSSGNSISIQLVDSIDGIVTEILPKIPVAASAPGFPALLNITNPPGFFYHSSTTGSTLTFKISGGATLAALITCIVNYALTNVAG